MVKTGANNMMMKWKRGNSESYVNLFSFDNAGTFTSTKSQRVTVSSYGYTDLIKGPGNLFISAEQGYKRRDNVNRWGLLVSTLSTDGKDDVYVVDTERMTQNVTDNNNSYYRSPSITALNDSIYAIGYRGFSYDGFIETFKVETSGKITRLKSYEYDVNESNYNKLVRVDSNTVAMIYR